MINLEIPEDRLKHCYLVGKLLEFIGTEYGMSDGEQIELFTLGYMHDALLDFERTIPDIHANLMGNIVRWKYSKEIMFHSKVTNEYESDILIWLYIADIMVADEKNKESKYGLIASLNDRLIEAEEKYGKQSNEYFELSRKISVINCSIYNHVEKDILQYFVEREE